MAIKHILFPYDFSKPGLLAARFVRATANRYGARVTVLGVVPPIWNVPPIGMPGMEVLDREQLESDFKIRLDGALREELMVPCVERVTDYGDPAVRITEFAKTHAVDLIMMPTHGFGLFRNLLIGSVTAKVLHDAECPVWTATHAEEQHAPEVPKTIVCAVDSTGESPRVMQWAAEFGQKTGAALKLLHVVPPISDWLALASERELQEQVREAARANVESLRRTSGVEASLRIAVGKISDTVAEEARQEGADLVVIGRGALQSTLGRLRTHSYGIIQRSPCPVVSV